jgi:hypothetical protein
MSRTAVLRRWVSALLVSGVVAALTACAPSAGPVASPSATPSPTASSASPSPTPSPDPTRPALTELALSPAGLGPLELGVAPDADPATRMVSFDPEGCVNAEMGIAPGDPAAGLWRTDASYASSDPAYGPGIAFGVGVDRDTGLVNRIDLYSADIATDGGVRIGDPGSSIAAAHPGATVVEEYLTDIHVITGPTGTLQIEVAKNAADMSGDYWEGRAGTVVYIRAASPGIGVFTVAASGNLVGVCGA